MAAPGFGFSVNDVVLLAQVTTKVVQALNKEEATSEYQKATRDLESLQAVLETLIEFFNYSTNIPGLRIAIQSQFAIAARPIALFNKKLQNRYGNSLDLLSTPSPHRKVMKSVNWTFSAAEDLAKFRVELEQQLEKVTLLCILNNAQSSAKAASTALESKNLVSANIAISQGLSLATESHLRCPLCGRKLSNSSIFRAWFCTNCDQHCHLATMSKEAMNPSSSTTMKTKTVDVTDEEAAELHIYKNMHLLPSNEANSSNVSNINFSNQNLHQNKNESSNQPVVQTPDQHINPREQSSNTPRSWYCSHCRDGPISAKYCHCVNCRRKKDIYSRDE